MTSPRSAPLGLAFLVTFIAFFDTFTLIPTVGPYAESLGATAAGMGIAVGAYSATNLIFNIAGGVMLDRVGRRRLALAGFGLVTLSILSYTLVTSLGGLVLVRLLHGVGGGILIPSIYTLIGDLAGPGNRGRAMGRVGAVIGTAAIVAPGLAGVVRSRMGFTAVFVGLAVVMAAGFVLAATGVPETAGPTVTEKARTTSIRPILVHPDFRVACIGVFGFTFGFGVLSAFLPSDLEAMGYSASLSGGLFTLLSLIAALLMLTRVAGRVDAQGPRRPMLIGLPPIFVGLALLGLTGQVGIITLGLILFGIGFGVVYPAASGATAIAASPSERGRAFGVFNVFYSLGFVVGPSLAGVLDDRAGISPFLTAAVVGALATVAVAGIRASRPVLTDSSLDAR